MNSAREGKESRVRIGVNWLCKIGGGFIALVLSFWFLLVLVYCIPADAIRPQLEESLEILDAEGAYPASYTSEDTKFDNYTVVIMLSEAAQCGDPIINSLRSLHYQDDDRTHALKMSIEGQSTGEYFRYWHGYLVVLKPLLVFLNVKEIRLFFQMVFIVLLGIASIALYRVMKRRGLGLAVALCFSLALVGCADASATLPIFFSFAISLGALIWVTCQPIYYLVGVDDAGNRRLDSASFFSFCMGFMIVGAVTVYFDFLDNPIITLGIPLVALICRVFDQVPISEVLKICLMCSLLWMIGYGGAWLGKWVLAALVVRTSVFDSAFNAIALRAGLQDHGGFLDKTVWAIQKNYEQLGIVQWVPVVEVVLIVAFSLFILVVRKDAFNVRIVIRGVLALLLISALPLLWYAATSNHSLMHASVIAYRTLVVQLFALSASLVLLGTRIASMVADKRRSRK